MDLTENFAVSEFQPQLALPNSLGCYRCLTTLKLISFMVAAPKLWIKKVILDKACVKLTNFLITLNLHWHFSKSRKKQEAFGKIKDNSPVHLNTHQLFPKLLENIKSLFSNLSNFSSFQYKWTHCKMLNFSIGLRYFHKYERRMHYLT